MCSAVEQCVQQYSNVFLSITAFWNFRARIFFFGGGKVLSVNYLLLLCLQVTHENGKNYLMWVKIIHL